MTNNSPVYWTANGFSLHTMAWSVKSFGGQRWVGASKRGEDLQVPFVPGRIYVPKFRDARTFNLSMWVLPLDPATGAKDTTMTDVQRAHANYLSIIRAVDIEGQFDLVKRWWEGGAVHYATARAEYIEASGPDSDDKPGYDFSITLSLADPYFYSNTPVVVSGGAFTVQGDVPTDHVTFSLNVTGPARVDMSDGNFFTYSGGAGTLTIDSLTGIAMLNGTLPVNGLMSRNRDFWRYGILKPGAFTATFTSGISSGSISYYPAYR